MIVLDTNVVSAVMAKRPPESVMSWLDHARTTDLYLSSVTIAEICYGLEILPEGKRRRGLEQRFSRFVEEGFRQRVLPFDESGAVHYGRIMAHRRSIGRPMSIPDGQIAAMARQHRMAVATRNVADFDECGIEVINPYDDQGPPS